MDWTERTSLLFGKRGLGILQNANVLVVGLGGVGGIAAEMIARSGVGRMTIVDADVVEETNINRQLVALHSTIGKNKVDVLGGRLCDINPDLDLTVLGAFLRDKQMIDLLEQPFDYVVDAIDTLAPKVYLVYHSIQRNIPVVSSMGAGGKKHPELVTIADISKTHHCKLARMLRKRLGKLGVRKGFLAVFSPEEVSQKTIVQEKGQNKASNVGTISFMPSVFGCFCASVVVNQLLDKEK